MHLPNRIAVGAVIATAAVTAVVVLWHPPCPFEVTVATLETVEMFDDRGVPLRSVEVHVRNRTSAGIEFAPGIGCEIKIAGRWLSTAGSWSLRKMAGAGTSGRPASDGRLTLLLTADVDACRFRLMYRKIGRGSLPFGLRDPWAAIEAPSLISLRLQQALAWIPAIHNSLWPPLATNPRASPSRTWTHTTVTLAIPVSALSAEVSSDTTHNHSVEANRRPAAPLEAGSPFGSPFSALSYFPAAVAHLGRSPTEAPRQPRELQ